MECTLGLVKPGFQQLWGLVLSLVLSTNLTIAEMKTARFTPAFTDEFYAEHLEKPFFPALKSYMTSDQVLGMEICGENAIAIWRDILGPTNPGKAREIRPGSLRALYGINGTANVGHGSDSTQSSQRERDLFFGRKGKDEEL